MIKRARTVNQQNGLLIETNARSSSSVNNSNEQEQEEQSTGALGMSTIADALRRVQNQVSNF